MWSNIMVKSPALAPMTAARDDPFAVAVEPSDFAAFRLAAPS